MLCIPTVAQRFLKPLAVQRLQRGQVLLPVNDWLPKHDAFHILGSCRCQRSQRGPQAKADKRNVAKPARIAQLADGGADVRDPLLDRRDVRIARRVPRTQIVEPEDVESGLGQPRRADVVLVGDALERLFPERLSDLAPLLAHHFAEAFRSTLGVPWESSEFNEREWAFVAELEKKYQSEEWTRRTCK